MGLSSLLAQAAALRYGFHTFGASRLGTAANAAALRIARPLARTTQLPYPTSPKAKEAVQDLDSLLFDQTK